MNKHCIIKLKKIKICDIQLIKKNKLIYIHANLLSFY